MLDFSYTDDQLDLQQSTRQILGRHWSKKQLREAWSAEDDEEHLTHLWRTLAELEMFGLLAPSEQGGLGLQLLDVVLVLEELGRACAPLIVADTMAIAVPLLVRHAPLREGWLPKIVRGEAAVACAISNYRDVVPDAHFADLFVVQREGKLLVLAKGEFMGERQPSQDKGRAAFSVEISTLEEHAFQEWTGDDDAGIAWASVLNGISLHLLEDTLEYVKTRHQFGHAIGSFQALQHRLVDVHIAIDSARSAALYACCLAGDASMDATSAASVLKYHSARAFMLASYSALQFHGAIGFTWEHDLHYWLKRGLTLCGLQGRSDVHSLALGRVFLDS